MSNINMVVANLPPGFRFHPRDDELVCDYLMKKASHSCETLLLIEVDLNKCEPWDIPESACVGGKDWYFYSLRDRKYATGIRTNRATASGYWKATGKDRAILRKGSLVGMRKTLVFYQGRAPKGRKTDWVMHEFRMEGSPKVASLMEDWVLCRVFHKNGEALSAQQSLGSCNYDDTGSSSLPPLMDSHITFDHQTQPIHFHDQFDHDDDDHEQVPCFSIFSCQQQRQEQVHHDVIPSNPSIFSHMQQLANIDISTTKSAFGKIPVVGSACLDLHDPFSCDTKVIKAVLNQLTKTESNNNHIGKGSSPSLGEPSSESYLSEVGMPTNIWNNF